MQDGYVGDIGDFANNGLLRYLCGLKGSPAPIDPLRLGVVWFRYESDSADGNRIDYLNISDSNDHLYRQCDPVLYDSLQRLVGASLLCRNKRNMGQISDSLILPRNTQFYDTPVPIGERREWNKNALTKLAEADLVFINPDTGIAPKSVKRTHKKGPKYVFVEDLAFFYKKGKSLVIYQHLPRNLEKKGPEGWVKGIASQLKEDLKSDYTPRALLWRPVSRRTYFIVPATPEHENEIGKRLEILLDKKNSKWAKRGHFTEVEF